MLNNSSFLIMDDGRKYEYLEENSDFYLSFNV